MMTRIGDVRIGSEADDLPVTIAFDIGNSRIKAACFQSGSIRRTLSLSTSLDAEDRRSLALLLSDLSPRPDALICSVVPVARKALRRRLKDHGVPVALDLVSDGKVFDCGLVVADGLETPETTGIDRVLSVIAARRRSSASAVIVVGAGTAVTVNLLVGEDRFQGGAVLPGLRLMARSLFQGTAALPEIEWGRPTDSPSPLGRSTVQAIQAGTYYAAAGAIDRLVEELKEQISPMNVEVFLTGGDAEILRGGLRTPHRVEPHLVLEGLHHVHLHASAKRTAG